MTGGPLGHSNCYSFQVQTIDGEETTLDAWRGDVLLIVNVASRCGYTPQYHGLETLYRTHRDRGFTALGFPCNQFGAQEPGTAAEIRQFCSLTYDVTFPLFAKIEVNGPGAHPLYTWLKAQRPGVFGSASIKWNFTKFLVSREGEVIGRYGSRDTPGSIEPDVIRALDAPRR